MAAWLADNSFLSKQIKEINYRHVKKREKTPEPPAASRRDTGAKGRGPEGGQLLLILSPFLFSPFLSLSSLKYIKSKRHKALGSGIFRAMVARLKRNAAPSWFRD